MASFQRATIVLARMVGGALDVETAWLAAALEEHLRPRAAGMSLEVLRQLRDDAWFPLANATATSIDACSIPLSRYLRGIADSYLQDRGGSIGLRHHLDRDEATQMVRWRWLSLFVPPDLLISAVCSAGAAEPPADAVGLLTPQLRQLLSERVADTHLHLGAGFSFPRLWSAIVEAPPEPRDIGTGPDLPYGAAHAFVRLLLAAAIARLVLAAFLAHGAVGDFMSFWDSPHGGRDMAARLSWPDGRGAGFAALNQSLALLLGVPVSLDLARLRQLYRRLVQPLAAPAPTGDPLVAWLPGSARSLPETRFAARAVRYMTGSGAADPVFARVFWQYQRVRCSTYRYVVQEPSTAGLDWFQRHYQRLGALRGSLDHGVRALLELESAGLGLESIEMRSSPVPAWAGVRDFVRLVVRQTAEFQRFRAEELEVGIVFHFTKEEVCRGCGRFHADPRHAAYSARFGAWFADRLQQALGLARALAVHPELLLVMRGLDVASAELSGPSWVVGPLFAYVDDAARTAAATLARRRPAWAVPPLRHTIHAGEDYRRLVEGLRRMHELIEPMRLIRMGDRIGHGFALGVDPQRWAAAARVTPQPREERLDDLLWELERYARGDWKGDAGRLEYARAEVVRLAGGIYGRRDATAHIPWTVEELMEARRLRHDRRFLEALGYPIVHEPRGGRAERLAWLYLVDGTAYEAGRQPEAVVATASEVAMLREAQRWLRALLARLEITLETNPSSNLLIGDLLDVEDHPVFRLQPIPGRSCDAGPAVLVSVNDDDPVTFATRLSDEFAYLYGALLRAGVSAQEGLQAIDCMRQNGWRSRFTLRASRNPDNLAMLLEPQSRPTNIGTAASASNGQ
jgi:hypothetical protein